MRLVRVAAAGLVAMVTLAACGGGHAKVSDTPTLASGGYGVSGEGVGGGMEDASASPSAGASPSANASAAAKNPGTTKATSGGTSGGSNGAAAPAPMSRGQREVVRYGVPIGSYPALLNQAIAAGYKPVSLDGYDVGSATYVNAVFRPSDKVAWYQYIEMSASGYQSRFNSLKSQGYRLVSVESYLHGGQIRYAGLWSKSSGPAYYAFHGYSASNYQTLLNKEKAAGYLPANVSVVAVGSTLSYTGLFEKRSLGNWELKSTLSPADFQSLFNQETKAGMATAYLNAYTVNGTVKIVALFASSPKVAFETRYGLTATQAASDTSAEERAGYLTSSAAGYNDGGQAHFLTCWTR